MQIAGQDTFGITGIIAAGLYTTSVLVCIQLAESNHSLSMTTLLQRWYASTSLKMEPGS
jgi:hypothetical protein